MAAVVNETKLVTLSGGVSGRVRVCGNVVNAAEVSFVIKPGNSDVNVSGSSALRKMDSWGISNNAAAKAPIVVKTYSSTYDEDILTVTCASGDDFNFWVEGDSAGA